MGCAGSVPHQEGATDNNNTNLHVAAVGDPNLEKPLNLPEAGGVAGTDGSPNKPPVNTLNPTATSSNAPEAKYFKGNIGDETTPSLFCGDDDGCATVATNHDVAEDAASAHRYVDYVAKERRSIAQLATEPSAFAAAISHKFRVARAYVKYGITSDVEQYQDEVDRAVPIFGSRAKLRVWDWLRNVVQAPPRGTRVETVRLFKRVQRGSVISLSGSNLPDIRRSVSLSRPPQGASSVHGGSPLGGMGVPGGGGGGAGGQVFSDDVLDELLLGASQGDRGGSMSPPAGSRAGGAGLSPQQEAGLDHPPRLVVTDINNEPAFDLPDNYGLVANNLAVGTVIGMDGDGGEYDLIVVEEEAEIIEEENDQPPNGAVLLNFPSGTADGLLLSPHTYGASNVATSTSSHRDTSSSVNSKGRFDYMSVSQHSLLADEQRGEAAKAEGDLATPMGGASSPGKQDDPAYVRETGRDTKTISKADDEAFFGQSSDEIEAALKRDPICRSIHNHNALAVRTMIDGVAALPDDKGVPESIIAAQ